MKAAKPRVGLFVTCLVDLFRPSVGFSAVKLLEDAGCAVDVPRAQTCCGQPAYNSGDKKDAREIARQVIEAFDDFDYVVAPSGSCSGMLAKHYPELFAGDAAWEPRAKAFSAKVHELVSFLADVMFVSKLDASHRGTVTYHDSCSAFVASSRALTSGTRLCSDRSILPSPVRRILLKMPMRAPTLPVWTELPCVTVGAQRSGTCSIRPSPPEWRR